VPVLARQQWDDEYGTLEQLESVRRALPQAAILTLANCRHSPHRDRPAAVLEATRYFIDGIARRHATV
jgi:pimeloyl-ACP methyl ester carboxylesterase